MKVKEKHNMANTTIYRRWIDIKKRCYNPNFRLYHRYGGRGITVCDEWKDSFLSFYNWAMSNGYKDELTIDRIDNDKGYSPDNCRFVTRKIQGNNKSTNFYITYHGETKTLAEWCDKYDLHYERTRQRIQDYHWSIEKAFNTKGCLYEIHRDRRTTPITINNETKTIEEWCNQYNIKYALVRKRYFIWGWDIMKALSTPSHIKPRNSF